MQPPCFNEDCPVCLEPLSEAAHVQQVCQHAMHKECAVKWWARNPACPICRKVDPRVTQLVCKALQLVLAGEVPQRVDDPSSLTYATRGILLLAMVVIWNCPYFETVHRTFLYGIGILYCLVTS